MAVGRAQAGKAVWRRAAAAAALALAAGWGAAADPREVHQLGLQALAEERWADAARFFRAAIAERSEERVPGLIGRRYLPHYYLGIALAEQGDCRGALAAWSESESQGKIAKADNLANDLRRRRDGCRSRLREIEATRAEVEELQGAAEGVGADLAALAGEPALAPSWSAGERSYAGRQAEAAAGLERARRQLRQGLESQDLVLVRSAKELSSWSLEELRSTLGAARRELDERSAAADRVRGQLDGVVAQAVQAVRSIAALRPYPPGLGRRVAEVQRLLGRAEDLKDSPHAWDLEELRVELKEAVERLRQVAQRPPPRLMQAAEAFLGGRFQEVLDLLAESRFQDRRAAGHLCVLRAASRHALFVLGGEEDRGLFDQAGREAFDCEPTFELSPRFFSPRFIEFFEAARNLPELEEGEAEEPAEAGAGEAEVGD